MIDLDALKTDRDQLFAEAVFEDTVLSTRISLDPELWAAAGAEQDVGRSGKLLEDYLCHIFILIQDSEDARGRIEKILLTPKTFKHALSFLVTHRSEIRGIKLPVQQ